MKAGPTFSTAILGLLFSAVAVCAGQALPVQSFSAAMPAAGAEGEPAPADAQDNGPFADGTRAINEGHWADAVAIFAKIADRKSDHAEGALYWEAYAENKLSQSAQALSTCGALRTGYPKSSWLDDCGALEIEIQARSGKPVLPKAGQRDDLKLLALNSMMQHDESHARAQIQEILDDEDSSENLKQGALFILGKHLSALTFPQIVRVSSVEGDVRIARGRQNEKATGATWEKAATDTPLETGFNLVTGEGRAEVELEDASTVYLGENSVLTFNDLHTTDGIPYTEIALLSGTVTLDVKPYVAGEVFLLKTPTDDDLMTTYPHSSYMRVTSYMDATAITQLEGGVLRLPSGTQPTAIGQTLVYREGHKIDPADAGATQSFVDWDKWVSARVAGRAKATTDTMQAAGLTSPIPGMAEMQGQGRFFDCAPYGTCWEPTTYAEMARAGIDAPAPATAGAQASSQPANPAPNAEATGTAQQPANAAAAPRPTFGLVTADQLRKDNAAGRIPSPAHSNDDQEFFPCYPDAVGNRVAMDPVTGGRRLAYAGTNRVMLPYNWAVCHSGYWIPRGRHYVWVVGKRHHHEPLRWVKSGRTVAYVPIHPRDIKGQPPINGKEKVFAVNNKNGFSVEPIKLSPERPIELLKEPPREFRTANLPPLQRAEEPHVIARNFKGTVAGKSVVARAAGVPITFDHKSGNFMMAHQEMHGGRSVSVTAPIGNHSGNLQAHAGSSGGAAGGSHAGGGSGGSSGGSHGGSSGSSGSTASSSGSSSGGSSSGGGGGSHH
jgi:hypothetical protein